MRFAGFTTIGLVFPLVGAYLVPPPGTVGPGTTSECSGWADYASLVTCSIAEEQYGITEAEFEAWNPIVTEVGIGCTLLPSLYYCIQIDYDTVTTTSSPRLSSSTLIYSTSLSMTVTPTTTTTIIITTSGDDISTPTSYQTGMVTNCDKFHFVVDGDQYGNLASEYGISLNQFYEWNPAVGGNCQYLGLGDYVCVNVIGVVPSTATTATATATIPSVLSNGIATPTPYQSGMATNCDDFHLVVDGDQCGLIATQYGITLTQFYSWNPAVGTSCEFLDLGDYVCVRTETCSTASVLLSAPQTESNCGAPGFSHDGATSLTIASYTAGSPYVDSAAACGKQCRDTPSCTNIYFIQGSYCNLHEGDSTFQESTARGYYLWYELSCFSSPNCCDSPGFSNDGATSQLITSYITGSPYVETPAACGAQCLSVSSCTNVYFIEGVACNLHSGDSTFGQSIAAGYYSWYEASCFSSGLACGSYRFSNDNPSTLLVSYTSGSYVSSPAACGAQCLSTSGCTNVYFTQGSYCNLHSPSSFRASTDSGYYSWYQAGCFACDSYV